MKQKYITERFVFKSKVEFEKDDVLSDTEIGTIKDITIQDIWKYVFNTTSDGNFEVEEILRTINSYHLELSLGHNQSHLH